MWGEMWMKRQARVKNSTKNMKIFKNLIKNWSQFSIPRTCVESHTQKVSQLTEKLFESVLTSGSMSFIRIQRVSMDLLCTLLSNWAFALTKVYLVVFAYNIVFPHSNIILSLYTFHLCLKIKMSNGNRIEWLNEWVKFNIHCDEDWEIA